jgi:hypothetical protein
MSYERPVCNLLPISSPLRRGNFHTPKPPKLNLHCCYRVEIGTAGGPSSLCVTLINEITDSTKLRSRRVVLVVSVLDSEPGEPGSNLGACTD